MTDKNRVKAAPSTRTAKRTAAGTGKVREGLRELRDPRDMRALAHPTRLALLEVLTLHGPLTATEAGELVGESPSSCSFHLRSLAQHGFVEETGEGRGRQRPWRRVAIGTTMSAPYDDVQTEIAARTLADMYIDRYLGRLREAQAKSDLLEADWRVAQGSVESIMWVTVEELNELNDQAVDLALRYRERLEDPAKRPEGARAVEMLYFTYNTELVSTPDPPAKEESGSAGRRGRGRTPRGSRPAK